MFDDVRPLHGLCNVNVELTSRCNKNCWMCGRRERERLHGPQEEGDMTQETVYKIANELPPGLLVQLHNNGEPLVYPHFGHAAACFNVRHFTNIVTNGKLLFRKHDEIIGKLDTLSVSVFENDPEADAQYAILEGFLDKKGDQRPFVTARLIGNIPPEQEKWYTDLGLEIVRRTLHDPRGSVNYRKEPTKPEAGFCWDMFTRLAINYKGDVSCCVRYDPEGDLVLGNINETSLYDMWYGEKRQYMLAKHIQGRRCDLDYCGKKCHYWGVPTGV